MDIRRAYAEWFARQPESVEWRVGDDALDNYGIYEAFHARLSTLLYSLEILWPNFIERDGMILRDLGRTEEEWQQWRETNRNSSPAQIEFLNNHLHVWDTFMNDPDRDKFDDEMWGAFWQHYANTVADMWRCRLKQLFPDKEYIVEVYEGYGPEITVYTPRPDATAVAPVAPSV